MRFINIGGGTRGGRGRRRCLTRGCFVLDFEIARFRGTLTQGAIECVLGNNNHEFENFEGLSVGAHRLLGLGRHRRVADDQEILAQALDGQFQLLARLSTAVHGRYGVIFQEGMGGVEGGRFEARKDSSFKTLRCLFAFFEFTSLD